MPKYRALPVVIEATQWFPDRIVEGVFVPVPGDGEPALVTPERKFPIQPGDWIVTGVMGERHVVRSDVFAATYERVLEPVR